MAHTYSTYEAKARFSEVLRQVRSGQTVVIAYRGEPVAEMRPIAPAVQGLAGRVAELKSAGVLVSREGGSGALRPLGRRAGALKRFLEERD